MKGIIMESRIEDHGISRRFVIPESASLLDMDMVVSTIMWMEPMSDGMTVLSTDERDIELFERKGLEAPLSMMGGCLFELSNVGSVCEVEAVGETDPCYPHAAELIEMKGNMPPGMTGTDHPSDMVQINDRLLQTGILGCPVPGWRRIDLSKRLEIIEMICRFDALALFYRWETGDVVRVDDPDECRENGTPPPDISMDDLDPEDPAYSFICSPTMELMSIMAESGLERSERVDDEGHIVVTDPTSISVLLRLIDQRTFEIPMEWADRNHVSFVLDMDMDDSSWNDGE